MSRVFLIGTPEGAKVNQYESMTNSREESVRLASSLCANAVIKEVEVKPPYKGKRT